MDRNLAVILTLVVYQVLMLAIGFWAIRRTRDTEDFFLGGRRLGPVVAAISASASSSSAWTLLGVSGAAYLWGMSAIWLLPATLSGFLINWFLIAPRLARLARESGVLTLSELIAGNPLDPGFKRNIRLCSLIILFSFLFYVAAQFQAAGDAFANTFGWSARLSLLVGAGIILVYTLLGGFWAVSVTDTLQGLMMALSAVVIPLVALVAVGGPLEVWQGLQELGPPAASLSGSYGWFLGLFFVLGTLGIGMGYPGQPHVVNRFMAMRSAREIPRARAVAIGWALLVYPGMLVLGWSGRILFGGLDANEQIFFEAANQLLPPVLAGIMIAAVLSAIMSTADSQLLVASSSVAYDWQLAERGRQSSIVKARAVVILLGVLSVLLAIYAPEAIFSRVLFAFHALGSSFGPILLIRIYRGQIASDAVYQSLLAGVGLTILFNWLPDTPGDFAERLLPFAAAFLLAWRGLPTVGKVVEPMASVSFPEDRDYD
jgi:sodium/proline symporter